MDSDKKTFCSSFRNINYADSISKNNHNLSTGRTHTGFIEEDQQLKSKRNHEDNREILTSRIRQLEDDLEYYDKEHRRQLQNLQVMLSCQYNRKIIKVKTQLREKYQGMELQNQKMKKQMKNKEKQIQMLQAKCVRSENYCKNLQHQMKQIEKDLKNSHKASIDKITIDYEEKLQKMKAQNDFQSEYTNKIHKQEQKELQKELQFIKNKLSDVLKEYQQIVIENQEIRQEKDSAIKQKAKIIERLNAKIEGLQSYCEKHLTSYISESKKMREQKLNGIEEICRQMSENKENQKQQHLLSQYQRQLSFLRRENIALKRQKGEDQPLTDFLETRPQFQINDSPCFGKSQ